MGPNMATLINRDDPWVEADGLQNSAPSKVHPRMAVFQSDKLKNSHNPSGQFGPWLT